jgi:hypothetical protein
MHRAQSLINHVVLVLDASYSMKSRQSAVVKVTDEQIRHLAKRSEELSQETRVSVYRFGEQTIECLIFDMDVARLPSASDLYEVLYENTSLIDATMKSQEDLATTSTLYGDHAFLTFVLTDGQENRSVTPASTLAKYIANMDVNWSIGFLVPDQTGVRYVERLGVLRDSIAVWDTRSASGINDAASAIRTATDNFMTQRSQGVRGTRSVFSTSIQAVNKETVKANLAPLKDSDYVLTPVDRTIRIDDFVNDKIVGGYAKGKSYYQLTKSETIQPQKQIIVVEKKTGKAFTGQNARDLIGLSSVHERVRPDRNPKYEIYVQSTSYNRKLVPGTRVLTLT